MPNKVTTLSRQRFLATFDNLAPDLEKWIRETASGWEAVRVTKDGNTVTLNVGKDPAKAADLLVRMAEYHLPKLGRQELVGDGGGAIQVQIVKYADKPEGE